MRSRNLKTILPPPIICASLAALLLAACSLIQEMPKEFMDTYGNIAHVEKVEYEGLAEGGGDTPLVTETRDFRIIYTIGNPGDFDLAPEFSFEGCDAEIRKVETERRRVSLTVSGASLGTLEDGAALKVRLLLYMASQKILQSAYETDLLYVRTGPAGGGDSESPSGGDGASDQGGVDPSNPGDPSGGGDASNPGGSSGAEDPSDTEPEEPVPPGNTVYVRGKDAAWYRQNNPDAEASDENSGDEDAPFATVQRAVDEILARNDGEGRYAILIDGTLEGDRGAGENGMADFSALGKDLTLTIKALSGTATLDAGANVVIDDDGGATVMPEGIGKRVIYAKPASGSLALTLESLAIKGGNTLGNGGGIYASGISLTMKDCEVSGNAANAGGGVYANGTFTMSGGSISKNASPSTPGAIGGGGVYIAGGTFDITGGEIAGNTSAKNGGGVYATGGTLTMAASAAIRDNNTTDGNGGGVFVNKATFMMTGGSVSGNDASINGGGVYVNGEGSFTMSGGTIGGTDDDKNTAYNGGGVYNNGAFTMEGGTIDGNDATVGGGVYVTGSTFNMTGGTIDRNDAIAGGGVYVTGSTFNMTGGTIGRSEVTGSGNTASGNGGEGGGVYVYSGKFNMSGGTIDGNEATDNGGAVYVGSSVPFTLSSTAKITSNIAKKGGGVYFAGTNFTMTGGSITGNAANGTDDTSGGGGVYLASGAFEMSGGTIGGSGSDKNTAKYGGGVYAAGDSAFTMSGNAAINGNEATAHGGGVYVASSKTFTMSGSAAITDNTANTNGGGVYDKGTFNMTGGTISGNAAYNTDSSKYGGGGVYIVSSGTFSMSGGKIGGKNVGSWGSGVYIADEGTFDISGSAEINDNTAKRQGTGVYVDGINSKFTMSGGAKIGARDYVYFNYKNCTITITDALTAVSPVATITPCTYSAGNQVLVKGGSISEITDICNKFAVKPNGTTKWTIMPDDGKRYGVLAKPDVSGDGIEVTMPGGDVYTFEVIDGNYKIIVTDTSELKQGSTILLISVTKNGTALAGSDGTFTIEIQDASKTRFEDKNNPPYNTGFNQPAHVPTVSSDKVDAFVYVKAELKDGPTVETHISVTIVP